MTNPQHEDERRSANASDRRAKVQDAYCAITSDIADEYYPKGDKRRGEFLRDQAVLLARLLPELDKAYSDWFMELPEMRDEPNPVYGNQVPSVDWKKSVRNELRAQLRAAVSKEMGAENDKEMR